MQLYNPIGNIYWLQYCKHFCFLISGVYTEMRLGTGGEARKLPHIHRVSR